MSDIESDRDQDTPMDDQTPKCPNTANSEEEKEEADADDECDWGNWEDDDVNEDVDALEMLVSFFFFFLCLLHVE